MDNTTIFALILILVVVIAVGVFVGWPPAEVDDVDDDGTEQPSLVPHPDTSGRMITREEYEDILQKAFARRVARASVTAIPPAVQAVQRPVDSDSGFMTGLVVGSMMNANSEVPPAQGWSTGHCDSTPSGGGDCGGGGD